MGLFRKKQKILDLTEGFNRYAKTKMNPIQESKSSGNFDFFSGLASGASSRNDSSSSGFLDSSEDSEDKRKKLAKRLVDMTSKIEELSNQIYHLQQRIEFLEKKINSNRFE